jgi:hypothetical protein
MLSFVIYVVSEGSYDQMGTFVWKWYHDTACYSSPIRILQTLLNKTSEVKSLDCIRKLYTKELYYFNISVVKSQK